MEREFRRAVGVARDRGQTLFLSSHQLAEVEAVCDRVGILRAGGLVEVATVAELRRLHRSEVTVTYTGTLPDLTAVSGVDRVREADGRLQFALTGPPGPALRTLAEADVAALAVREPSLEEIFLDYYGEAAR
jgi:ABC-2 type transport system ATP-binding protein